MHALPAVGKWDACLLWEVHTWGQRSPWLDQNNFSLILLISDVLEFCLRKRKGSFRFNISSLPYLWPFKRIFLKFAKKDKTKKETFLWCREILFWHAISGLISAKKFVKWWERWLLLCTYIISGSIRQ